MKFWERVVVFTLATFREVKKTGLLQQLLKFHTENKFLRMGYSQKELRILGNVLANQDKQPLNNVFSDYEHHLFLAFSKAPRYTSEINVLDHAFGYISQDLSTQEKKFYAGLIEKVRKGQISSKCSNQPCAILGNTIRATIPVTTNFFSTIS